MTTNCTAAAALRYLSEPLHDSISTPLAARALPSGVRYTNPSLILMASSHFARLGADQLETVARHFGADLAHLTYRTDAGVSVDVAMRVAGSFEAFRGLALLEYEGTRWMTLGRRRLWVRLDGCGLQLAARAPTSDAGALTHGKEQALASIVALAGHSTNVVELHR
ncbi:hypothetical protein SAMN06297144_1224 [Sphingomonas guangdongensis]|uniref:Uncharacterized protein n=1 Tax=Sphingomonas guangdongensis TaxID=1141890 RepID=A0A285QL17_9SPHN|nr:hypothetical protein [Sphingomonas guangdongensis]SOB80762.1 hypothetical protein SAMN06297144_1224 [Sphingomonas guangdongensis]